MNFNKAPLSLMALIFFMLLPNISKADSADDYLLCEMKTNQIPGLSIAVVNNGGLLKAKAMALLM